MHKKPGTYWLGFMRIGFVLTITLLAFAAPAKAVNLIGVGARYHTTHSRFSSFEYPFREGDISYQAGFELQEGAGFWQLMVGYTPSVDQDPENDAPEIDSIITPQLNLILQDRGWIAGAGILSSYIEDEVESDWTDIYWQTMIGYQLQLHTFSVDLMAVYPFDEWKNLSDFKFDNLEASITIKKSF